MQTIDITKKVLDKVYVGIEVGSISVKVAVIGDEKHRKLFQNLCSGDKFFSAIEGENRGNWISTGIAVSRYQRVFGEPFKVTLEILKELFAHIPEKEIGGMRVTGSGSKRISELLNIKFENEFCAVANGLCLFYPQVKTILEMGGDNSKYMRVQVDRSTGMVRIVDYEKNGDCAAGTGSFIDQQAQRLLYKIEDVGDIVLAAQRTATIAGRCSVFAKSDMIHAQQKGFKPPEVLKGLCEAVVRNFKGTITKGKEILPPVAFIGGVAANKGVVKAVKTFFELGDHEFFVPTYYAWMGAIGTALLAVSTQETTKPFHWQNSWVHSPQSNDNFPGTEPLRLDKVILLRHLIKPYTSKGKRNKSGAYLGLDIGSVSTNLVVVDEAGDVVKEIYTRTDARPIEVVNRCLKEIGEELGNKIHILGAGTTGSGRDLIGELIGADSINDEITAHKTGAVHISERFLDKKVDTIFDIGGQDSKYISIEDGIVVDFTMNEACAAGTGSFLEEQAEELGIKINNQFAQMALRSKNPLRLGERCTVFMAREIKSYLLKNASIENIAAGLAYSVVINYLNRVVRDRKIGDVIFFQGGTAYNDAVAAAFTAILNKEIIVPPHNGVIGAIGAALLARKRVNQANRKTMFRGFNLGTVNYTLKNFTCKGCPNYCDVSEFDVEGEKTYWGDQCSERYRIKAKSEKKSLIDNLIKSRQQLLLEGYRENVNGGPKIGLPRSLYYHDRFPFWSTFFTDLGFQVVISGETNKQIINWGLEALAAEPCFPIAVAHGHIRDLIEKGVDYIFQSNMINAETEFPQVQSWYCPWTQTLPFMAYNNNSFKAHKENILRPTIYFREGLKKVKKELGKYMAQLGISNSKTYQVVEKAYKTQQEFERKLQQTGAEALEKLASHNELGIVLLGRPYNINDRSVNLNVPEKLQKFYGINVIPMEFLPLKFIDIDDINNNMFWEYGRKVLQAAKFVGQFPYLHIIYITNFKCGPDSYLKYFIRQASHKPFLSLQFDGHSNDAGIMTRCEAYLASKGFLR